MLMRLTRILDGKVMQPELGLDARQQFIARLEHPDPDNVTGLLGPFSGFFYGDVGNAFTASVYARSHNTRLRRRVSKRLVLDARIHRFLSENSRYLRRCLR